MNQNKSKLLKGLLLSNTKGIILNTIIVGKEIQGTIAFRFHFALQACGRVFRLKITIIQGK